MPNSEDSSQTHRHFPCSWAEIFDETQWGTSVPTKVFLWNNSGIYVDFAYPNPSVTHFKGAWKFLGSSIQTVLPGDLGEQVYKAVHDAADQQRPVIGTYGLTVDNELTTVVIRFLPLKKHVLGLVHDFPSGTHPSPEALEQGDVSPNLIRPTTLKQGPFSKTGIPHIHVSIPLHSIDDTENAPLAQNLEEIFIKNLANSFQLKVTEVVPADTRSFNCSGPLPMIAKFLYTLKALFPPESTET